MQARVPPPHPDYLEFLAPFEPRVRDLALAMRKLGLEEARDAMELIYDASNAVATGYSFTGRPRDSFIQHRGVCPLGQSRIQLWIGARRSRGGASRQWPMDPSHSYFHGR